VCKTAFKHSKIPLKNIKFPPKIFTAISFLLLLMVFIFLFLGRKNVDWRINLLLNQWPDFYQHVSNLCISYFLYAGVGYFWLMMGLKMSNIAILGGVVLLANFIYELWISILNTPDIVDAYYGFVGTIVAFIFLLLSKAFGLQIKKPD
jgi:hypothetical protein